MLIKIDDLIINTDAIELVKLNASKKNKDGTTSEGLAAIMFSGRSQYTWLSPEKAALFLHAMAAMADTVDAVEVVSAPKPKADTYQANGYTSVPPVEPFELNGNGQKKEPKDPSENGLSKAQITAKRQIEAIAKTIPPTDLPQMSIHTRNALFEAIRGCGWNAPDANAPLIVRSLTGKYKRDIAHISEVEGAAIAQWLPSAPLALIDAIFPAAAEEA